MTGELDPQRWTAPGAPSSGDGDLDLTRVSTRAEARALAEAVAQQQAPPVAVAPRRPVVPAPVPSPHVPGAQAPGAWGAAASPPPRPYTPVTPPPTPTPPPPVPATRSGLSIFGTVVRVLTLLSAVAYGARGLAALWVWTTAGTLASRTTDLPLVGVTSVERTDAVLGPLVSLAIALVCFGASIAVIVWLSMVAGDRRADRRRMAHGPAGTVLGFFLPVVCLWWPYQSMRDAWRATDLRPGTAPTPMSIIAWWGLTITGYVALFTTGFLLARSLVARDADGAESQLLLGLATYSFLTLAAQVCLSVAIGRVCLHLDAHDLLQRRHERLYPPHRTA